MKSLATFLKFLLSSTLLTLALATGVMIYYEMHTSQFQAHYFAVIAKQLNYKLADGISPAIRFPAYGPYDERLGYTRIAEFTKLLAAQQFVVSRQVRMSPAMLNLSLSPIYAEKDQAGLVLYGSHQQLLYSVQSPAHIYADFDAVPKLLTDTLLFIEDRELLDTRYPMRNPAVNWSRLNRAVFDQAVHVVIPSHSTPGASTLITQIEKYRHSPDGRTTSAREKLLQMKSASIRAYLYGENNMTSRRQAVVAYFNTVPLSALAGYGEVNGFADGMRAWYGRDFSLINETLKSGPDDQNKAQIYKQALSLMIAQRRPSYYLREGTPLLLQKTNQHLQLLASEGVISKALLKAALPLPLKSTQQVIAEPEVSFVIRKAANLLRTDLSNSLHVPRFYALDRLDLSVHTTLDGDAQRAVTDMLIRVREPEGARAAGLYGNNMLQTKDNTQRLAFSFTLFERTDKANLLRVQTDNLDQPFDINSGARLNLGSTAKLRTLITYLEIIKTLHASYAELDAVQLSKLHPDQHDVISLWALNYFGAYPHSNLPDTLEAAMLRTYSGNPSEAFFTGGGVQRFENFDPEENSRIMTVREGFQHSVNLVFVRLMRDVVRHYEHKTSLAGIENLTDPLDEAGKSKLPAVSLSASDDSVRQMALSRFADKEGREYLLRFYKKYKGKTPAEREQILIDGMSDQPKRLTILFRSLKPDADFAHFVAFMQAQDVATSREILQGLYDKYAVDQFSLTDRGYLVGIHPLELWLVSYLQHHPAATRSEIFTASADQRQEVYQWLFKTHNKMTQESRIHQMLELDAFEDIAADWRHLGYPFKALTPSIASALGASGDRPSSLAELMGIIVNDGMLMPAGKIDSLQFAQGTPYETDFVYKPAAGVRVLPEEITRIVRRSLTDVVQGGTGVRLKGGFTQNNGTMIEIGGKTGTGDQRFVSYAANGRLIESRAVNRSATFVFEIGDRFFGTITAYVHEPYAADYTFTSAMTVQLLKALVPALQPMVAAPVKPL